MITNGTQTATLLLLCYPLFAVSRILRFANRPDSVLLRIHIRPQNRVHPRQMPLALLLEPLEHIRLHFGSPEKSARIVIEIFDTFLSPGFRQGAKVRAFALTISQSTFVDLPSLRRNRTIELQTLHSELSQSSRGPSGKRERMTIRQTITKRRVSQSVARV